MSEPDDGFAPRLEGIETQWSLLQRAQLSSVAAGIDARQALVLRYSNAIRAYVAAMVRNDQDADEVSQEVMLRLMRGDFAGADPQRGRFRDLIKMAVRNMVRNHWQKEHRRRGVTFNLELMQDNISEGEHVSEGEHDPWMSNWRKNLLDLAWTALEAYQRGTPGSLSYTVLRLRADYPAEDSEQLAQRLSTITGREIRADAFRQQLKRARTRFAEFIVEEIAQGLPEVSPQRLQEELICLGLFEHLRDVLPRNWRTT